MKTINITAKTEEEAITKACVEFSVTSDRLEHEVIRKGSSGFFGIGAKDCEIRAWVKETEKKPGKPKDKAVKKAKKASKDVPGGDKDKASPDKDKKPKKKKDKDKEKEKDKDKAKKDKKSEKREKKPVELLEDPAKRAGDFLDGIFECMHVQCNYKADYDAEAGELKINLSGDDVGVAIGKRGQTLDALQYLTGQVVNKHQRDYVRVKIDTENYRERRKENLESFAKSMADKARANSKPIVLEPMNAYERRIIHSAIQSEEGVTTRSEGEEPYRHIVIVPSKR